jgi:midasin (ATPase involved in ribosome maturation)
LVARPEIDKVLNVITLQLGPQIMVAIKAKMSGVNTLQQLVTNINNCETELKRINPEIKWVFFEPDIEK